MALGFRVTGQSIPYCRLAKIGVSIVHMAPGERVKRHRRHEYEEAYYIIDGTGVMYLEGVGDIELFPGRSAHIPPRRSIHGQVNNLRGSTAPGRVRPIPAAP